MEQNDNQKTKHEEPKTRKRIIIGCFFGAVLATLITTLFIPFLTDKIYLLLVVFFVVVLIISISASLVNFLKNKISLKLFGTDQLNFEQLSEKGLNAIEAISNKSTDEAIKEAKHFFNIGKGFIAWFSYYRLLFVLIQVLFIFFGTLIGSILLFNQNELLTTQNEKIDLQNNLFKSQNRRLDQQTNLQEAERRSSLVFLLGNILDAVDNEIKTVKNNEKDRKLSPQLTGQIIALSSRLKPYKYLDPIEDNLTNILSPERAQLLISLLESKLDTSVYKTIFNRADFSYSEFNDDNLNGYFLKGTNLSYSEFSGADLANANLDSIDFHNSDLSFSNLTNASMKGTLLDKVDLSGAIISESLLDSELFQTDLSNINFRGFNLSDKSFSNCDLFKANLNGVKAINVDFFRSDLEQADLSNSDFSNGVFTFANLSFTNLQNSVFDSTILYNVVFDFAQVDSLDWIDNISSVNKEQIQSRYDVKELSISMVDSLKRNSPKNYLEPIKKTKKRGDDRASGASGGWDITNYYLVRKGN